MAQPYYQDDNVTLYQGDCQTITDWMKADVLITDPPYGMNYQSKQGKKHHAAIIGDESTRIRDLVLERWGGKPALVFGTWRAARPSQTRLRMVWWKKGNGPGMGDLTMPWGSSDEEIYVLGRGFKGRRRANVLVTDEGQSALTRKIGHPTPKPLSLMAQLIECCPPEWVIGDPFAGSGSTLLAARDLGRRAIGVEMSEKYCEIAARRLAGLPPMKLT